MIALLLLIGGACVAGRLVVVSALVGTSTDSSVALVGLTSGAYLWWYAHRSVPDETREAWFDGITYTRLVRTEPRPVIIHLVTIWLDAAGIAFLVTPPESAGEHPLRGQTTSAFLERHRLQVAINGSFFFPWYSKSPWDYYPHVGDPVSVHGLAISNGQTYAGADLENYTLFLTRERRAVIGTECAGAVHAISGRDLLVRDGVISLAARTEAWLHGVEPRTAVALNKNGSEMRLFVIDGRQPNYSEGVTLAELAEIIRTHDGWTALHLDGGGSSTLVREGPDGSSWLSIHRSTADIRRDANDP